MSCRLTICRPLALYTIAGGSTSILEPDLVVPLVFGVCPAALSLHPPVFRREPLRVELTKAGGIQVGIAAQELHLTGCSVTTEALSVVVVEGGPKSHQRYNKLMLGRIKWDEEEDEDDNRHQDEDGACSPPLLSLSAAFFCSLVLR